MVLRLPRHSWWLAGLPLGLMLVLKSAGTWLCALFLVTRQWRLLLGAMGTALVVVICFSAFVSWDIWQIWLRDTLQFLATDPTNNVTAYQTVSSLTGHLFVRDRDWNPHPVIDVPWLEPAEPTIFFDLAEDRLDHLLP